MAQVDAWVASLAQLSFDFTQALGMCRMAVISATKENFAGGHSPTGSVWLPLAHPRPNSKGTDRPLRNNGILMASVTARGAPGNFEQITPTRMEFGTNLDYAAVHQYGATIFPRSSKYLAIPLTTEAARAGRAKDWAGAKLRFQPFGKNSGKEGGFLVEDRQQGKPSGKGKKNAKIASLREAIQHYVLVKSVTIPARPFLGWNDELGTECGEILADAAAEAILKRPVSGGGSNTRMVA